MRTALLLFLLALPALSFAPVASACNGGGATLVDTGMIYVVQGSCLDDGPASVTVGPVQDAGVGIQGCSWSGPSVALWMESNGVPGRQSSDTLLVAAFASRSGQCPV